MPISPTMKVTYTLEYWGIVLFHWDSLKRNYLFPITHKMFRKPLKHIRPPNSEVSKTKSSFISNVTYVYKAGFRAKAMLEKLSIKPKQNSYPPNKGSNSGLPEYMISLHYKYFEYLWLGSSLLVLANVHVHSEIKWRVQFELLTCRYTSIRQIVTWRESSLFAEVSW